MPMDEISKNEILDSMRATRLAVEANTFQVKGVADVIHPLSQKVDTLAIDVHNTKIIAERTYNSMFISGDGNNKDPIVSRLKAVEDFIAGQQQKGRDKVPYIVFTMGLIAQIIFFVIQAFKH